MMPGWLSTTSPPPTKGPFSGKTAYFSFQADVHYAADSDLAARGFKKVLYWPPLLAPLYLRLKWEARYGQR